MSMQRVEHKAASHSDRQRLTLILTLIVGLVAIAALFAQGQGGSRPTPELPNPPYIYVELCETNTVAQTYALGTAARIIAAEGCTDIHIRRLAGDNWHIYGTKTVSVTN